MRLLALTLAACLLTACGTGDSGEWRVSLLDISGSPMPISYVMVVQFEPGKEPRLRPLTFGGSDAMKSFKMPALKAGRYEVWVPGHRPVVVDSRPTGPMRLEAGYALDVVWRADAPIPEGMLVKVTATWRGPGDHPEALLRVVFPGATPPPGTRSLAWMEFVRGNLLGPQQRVARLHVPWPGPYRLHWGVGNIRIQEGGGVINAMSTASESPRDAVLVTVPAEGDPPRVVLPPQR